MKVSRICHIDLQIIKRVLFHLTGANIPAKKNDEGDDRVEVQCH